MPNKYTENDLAGLTDEERAALLEDEETSGAIPTGPTMGIESEVVPEGGDVDLPPGDDDADKGGEDDKDKGKSPAGDDAGAAGGNAAGDDKGKTAEDEAAAAAAAAAGDGGKGAKPAGEGAGAEQEAAAPEIPRATREPLLKYEKPEGAETRIAEINTAQDALLQKLEDGEITQREYHTEYGKLQREQSQLQRDVDRYEMATEMSNSQAKNDWLAQVDDFLDSNPEYRRSEVRYRALDTEVRAVASTEEAATMTGAQILAKAHANILAGFGPASGAAPVPADREKGSEDKPADKDKEAKPAPKPKPLVPHLAQVPAAEISGTPENQQFQYLDKLADSDPLAFERALAQLSDLDRDRYLTSN